MRQTHLTLCCSRSWIFLNDFLNVCTIYEYSKLFACSPILLTGAINIPFSDSKFMKWNKTFSSPAVSLKTVKILYYRYRRRKILIKNTSYTCELWYGCWDHRVKIYEYLKFLYCLICYYPIQIDVKGYKICISIMVYHVVIYKFIYLK